MGGLLLVLLIIMLVGYILYRSTDKVTRKRLLFLFGSIGGLILLAIIYSLVVHK